MSYKKLYFENRNLDLSKYKRDYFGSREIDTIKFILKIFMIMLYQKMLIFLI